MAIVPIKRTQSVGVNYLPLGLAITMAQDNCEVRFKEELYKRSQICQKHLTPKVEYFNTIEQLKLAATDQSYLLRFTRFFLTVGGGLGGQIFLTVGGGLGGGLGGQIFNYPLEFSTTSWQGCFVVVEKLLSTPMSI